MSQQGSNPGPSPFPQGFVNLEQPFQAQPHGSRLMMQICLEILASEMLDSLEAICNSESES